MLLEHSIHNLTNGTHTLFFGGQTPPGDWCPPSEKNAIKLKNKAPPLKCFKNRPPPP